MKRRCSCSAPCRSGASAPWAAAARFRSISGSIAATNEDLEAAIARGAFRADLYHRINEFTLAHARTAADARGHHAFRRLLSRRGEPGAGQADRGLRPAGRRGHRPAYDSARKSAADEERGDVRDAALHAGEYITCRELPAELSEAPRNSSAVPRPLRNPAARGGADPPRAGDGRAATSRRRPNCSASTARPSTTSCIFTASNSRRVWIISTPCSAIPHLSTLRTIPAYLADRCLSAVCRFLSGWHAA